MQLAATQRPHAPPVPPRPSRQVVAEALKRSPKPLCPTRQAPPPPNTKPWRAQEKENGPNPSGRTIIYESTRETADRRLTDGENKKDAASELPCGLKNLERTFKPLQNNASNKVRNDGKPVEPNKAMPHGLSNKRDAENNANVAPECVSVSKNLERTVKLNDRQQQHRVSLQNSANNKGDIKDAAPEFSSGLKNLEGTFKLKESDANVRQNVGINEGNSDGKLMIEKLSYSRPFKTEINGKCIRADLPGPIEFPDDINPSEYDNVGRKRFSLVESDQIPCNSLNAVQKSESSPFHDRAITAKPPIPARPNSTGDDASSIPNARKSTDSETARQEDSEKNRPTPLQRSATKEASQVSKSEIAEQKSMKHDSENIKDVPRQVSPVNKNLEITVKPQQVLGEKNENGPADRKQLPTPQQRYLISSGKGLVEHHMVNPSAFSSEKQNKVSRQYPEKQSHHEMVNGDLVKEPQDPHQRNTERNRTSPNDKTPSECNNAGSKRSSLDESNRISTKSLSSESFPFHDRAISGKQHIPAVLNSCGDETILSVRKSTELKVEVPESPEIRAEKNKQGSTCDAQLPHRPTPSQRSKTKMESPLAMSGIVQEELVKSSVGRETAANMTICSDDCTTVVVMDEPERKVAFEDNVNIHHQDWLEAGIRYSSTQITLPGDDFSERINGFQQFEEEFNVLDLSSIREKIAMSSLQGLPPLPRSLSGFNLSGGREGSEPPPPPARSSSKCQRGARTSQPGTRSSPPARQHTTLDAQLAVLRREMFGLRQLDLSLLSQLWSLNESIQEFRQLLQEQEDRAPSPSPSSEEGDDTSYDTHPPPPPRRPPPVTHHHRQARPSPRDDSPSSEEYGAV